MQKSKGNIPMISQQPPVHHNPPCSKQPWVFCIFQPIKLQKVQRSPMVLSLMQFWDSGPGKLTSPLLLIPSVNQHRIRLASFSYHSFRGMCLSEQPLAVVIKKQQSSSTGATRCFLRELLPDLQISPGNSEMGCRVCIVIVAGLVCSAAVIIPRVSLCCLISQTFEHGNVVYSSYKFSQYYGAPSQ